jgi:hypothetical protein
VRRASGTEPERALEHVGVEDRLDHRLCGRLHNTVADSRNRQRPSLRRPAGLRNEHPASRKRTPPSLLQIRGQLVKQPAHAVLLDIGDGLAVDAGRAMIGAHQLPRTLQNVPAVDLVIERVEPSPGISLGRPVKRSLQFSDLVLLGGPSHDVALTSPSLYVTRERSSGPSHRYGLCCPAVASGNTAASDAHPARDPLPGSTPVIGPVAPAAPTPQAAGWAAITTRQASRDATDRSVAPPEGLLTLGFDPARFQTEPPACYRASWQLPGRDSHPQATTSLCWNSYSISNPPTLGALSEVL